MSPQSSSQREVPPLVPVARSQYPDVNAFLDALTPEHLARLRILAERIATRPVEELCKVGVLSKLESDLYEARGGKGSTNFRLLLCRCCNNEWEVVVGFLKKSQKLPTNLVDRARQRCREHRTRCLP